MVELKALINLEDVYLAQAKNYVVAYDLPVGLVINYGAASLQYKKVFNSKYNSQKKDPKDEKNNKDINKILKSANPENPDSDNFQSIKP